MVYSWLSRFNEAIRWQPEIELNKGVERICAHSRKADTPETKTN
jgi:hypothetical protein